jgi:lysophospholipase L1-like esterase
MSHIVLLGDSIFDNGVYVPGEPDVVRQLQAALPEGWRATLLAVDGAVTRSVKAQLDRLAADATHLVVSVGGNDALGESHVLGAAVRNVGEGVALLAAAQDRFGRDYQEMLEAVLAKGLPTALCTIYDTPASAPNHRIIKTGIAIFNDVITRAAFAAALPLIDLRLICGEDDDYANPIEPSAKGGDKIARAIASLVTGAAGAVSTVVARAPG